MKKSIPSPTNILMTHLKNPNLLLAISRALVTPAISNCLAEEVYDVQREAFFRALKESQADIAVFVANHMIKGDPIAPEAISWLDTKNSLVPEGWRLAITTNSEGMKGQLILGPHGTDHTSLVRIILHYLYKN